MGRKAAAVLGTGRKALLDQQVALDAAVKQLRRSGSRRLYVAATGTGKTLTSIRIAEAALQVRLVLVVALTLDLLAQTGPARRAEGYGEVMVIVSSMDARTHKGLAARGVGSTSDVATIAGLMAAVGEGESKLGR